MALGKDGEVCGVGTEGDLGKVLFGVVVIETSEVGKLGIHKLISACSVNGRAGGVADICKQGIVLCGRAYAQAFVQHGVAAERHTCHNPKVVFAKGEIIVGKILPLVVCGGGGGPVYGKNIVSVEVGLTAIIVMVEIIGVVTIYFEAKAGGYYKAFYWRKVGKEGSGQAVAVILMLPALNCHHRVQQSVGGIIIPVLVGEEMINTLVQDCLHCGGQIVRSISVRDVRRLIHGL